MPNQRLYPFQEECWLLMRVGSLQDQGTIQVVVVIANWGVYNEGDKNSSWLTSHSQKYMVSCSECYLYTHKCPVYFDGNILMGATDLKTTNSKNEEQMLHIVETENWNLNKIHQSCMLNFTEIISITWSKEKAKIWGRERGVVRLVIIVKL